MAPIAGRRLCRFSLRDAPADVRVGGSTDGAPVHDLSTAGIARLQQILDADDPAATLDDAIRRARHSLPPADVILRAPVEDDHEVWAAGVTYLRSKAARMEESAFAANAYDRVYDAVRPELFFKAVGAKVVGPGEAVGIRRDAAWSVPEPELALVIDSRGRHVGCTIGNDMSSRDIEGENLLYLPQAKIYDRSCALGPWIVLGGDEAAIRGWGVGIEIRRGDAPVFHGDTTVDRIKRPFADLVGHLCRCNSFRAGAVLLTGTGIVPDDSFSLAAGDRVTISISGIGSLANPVVVV
ncbi:MAG: fumarylacetoacetate hydrolase family protein [Planctomycetaceae bacterium]